MKTEESTPNSSEGTGTRDEKVGAYLKARREARGLTLDEVAARTRIKKGYLEAIEADDYPALPSGPFIAGFITSYARVLGIDARDIEPLIPEVEPPPIVDPAVRQDPEWKGPPLEIRELPVGGRGGTLSAWGIAIAVTLVVVAIVVLLSPSLQGWMGLDIDLTSASRSAGQAKETSVTETPRAGPSPEPGAEPRKSAGIPREAATGALASNGDQAGVKVAIDAGGRDASSASDKGVGDEKGLEKKGIRRLASIVGSDDQSYVVYTDDSLPPGEPQEIEIVTRNKSYLRVSKTLDGTPIFEDILRPGEKSRRFTYPGDLWMVVGNGGGSDIYYNGNRLPALGKFGERCGVAFRLRAAD